MLNAEDAKIPDDERDWNSLDIFVFSNGQQYTPPRKFHLHSDELKYWESTLKFLARSQYGSLHSMIELYSIDGKKVEGPLQLSNDGAYVAVTPPDPFIQSGYDKYLLKASRSWEKRQEKRFNNNTPQDGQTFRLSSIKVHKITNADTEKNKYKSNLPGKHVAPIRCISNKTPLTKSPLEKRKVLNSRNTILRKINNSGKLSTPQMKGQDISRIKKIQAMKKGSDNNTSPVSPPVSEITNVTILSKNEQVSENKTSITNAEKLENDFEVHRESGQSNVLIENTNETLAPDNEVVTPTTVYSNLESDAVSCFVDANKLSRNVVQNPARSPRNTSIVSIENKNNSKEDIGIKQSKMQEEINRPMGNNKDNVTITEKTLNTDNKECIINFNLNIELKNCNAHSVNSDTFRKCYHFNTEKHSQTHLKVDLSKDILIGNDTYTNKLNTIKSLIGDSCENKIIIIRCACGDNEINASQEEAKDHNIILLPQDQTERKRENDGKLNIEVQQDGRETKDVTEKAIEVLKHNTDPVPSDNPNVCESSAISDAIGVTAETADSLTSTITQTEWCDTLVEVRCGEDGCCSFYLPSLEKLKTLEL